MKDKRETINLVFSAFLITAFIICSYFFFGFANGLNPNGVEESILPDVVNVAVFVVFGLLVFYATRVGEGKARVRFSLLTLVIMVLPALYIIVATLAEGLPFHKELAETPLMMTLASVSLGYGIPYTFVSGFELVTEEIITDMPAVEGGVAEDVEEAEAEEAEVETEDEEEIVVEGTNPDAEEVVSEDAE